MKLLIALCLIINVAHAYESDTVYTPSGTYTCTTYDDGTTICF